MHVRRRLRARTRSILKTGHILRIGVAERGQTCPVPGLEQWLHLGQIDVNPLFRRTTRDNKRSLYTLLSDKDDAWLNKQTGPVPLSCRAECSFKRPSARMRPGISSPMLSGDGVGYRTHLCI